MLVHLYSENQLGEDLDAIDAGLGLIAKGFNHHDAMVGLFNGASSGTLIDGFSQHIVEIAQEIDEQYHVVIATKPVVEDLPLFVAELNAKMRSNRAVIDAMVDFRKSSLEAIMERELADSEAILMTMFMLGEAVPDSNILIGDCDVADETVHFVILRYECELVNSPAYVAVRCITETVNNQRPVLH